MQLFGTPAAQPVVAGEVIAVAQATKVPTSDPVVVPPVAEVVPPVVESAVVEVPETTEVLAEAVEITEEITIVKADPIPVTLLEEENTQTEEDVIEITQIAELVDPIDPLFSDFMSTSTGAIPATIDTDQMKQRVDTTPYFLKLLTQPTVALQIMYVAIGLFVLISLLLSIGIEIRRQHPVQIAYSLALLLLMLGLFKIHEVLSVGAVIV